MINYLSLKLYYFSSGAKKTIKQPHMISTKSLFLSTLLDKIQ
jgi:hypothetical protein